MTCRGARISSAAAAAMAATLAATAALLAAPARAADQADPAPLGVQTVRVAADSSSLAWIKNVAEAYEKRNPHVTVEVRYVSPLLSCGQLAAGDVDLIAVYGGDDIYKYVYEYQRGKLASVGEAFKDQLDGDTSALEHGLPLYNVRALLNKVLPVHVSPYNDCTTDGGTLTPLSQAIFPALSYPASACRKIPVAGSAVRTRWRRAADSWVPSATTTWPAWME